ncbi:MAG: LD-carboxypeptidase [Firmicutes bacterium]|nr:LD-carboxypeptidase [Bacillota bacterium]
MPMITPKPLRPGDTVAMIGISGCIHNDHPQEEVDQAAQNLRDLGFRVVVDPTCARQFGFLAGTDQERADALNRAFADDGIDGIWCIKGGYGCARMLDLVDWDMIRTHPKAFVGFSDITAVHIGLLERCGLQTFHSPMPRKPITEASRGSLMAAIAGTPLPEFVNPDGTSLTALRGGAAEGMLVGGNLSLISSACGTRSDLDTTGRILFLEEIDEDSYRVDGMLQQLYNAGKLSACAGIVFGAFTNCNEEYDHSNCFTVDELLEQMAARLQVPVLRGLQAGHLSDTLTLPLGRRVRLDADTCRLYAL